MSTPQPTFRVVLPSVPGGGPVEVRLRSLLKAALRAFGFRRVKVEELASRPRRRSRRVPPDREEKFMAECVNLLELFGEKYRITWDEAYDAKGKHRATIDVWYAQIPCRFGIIYPYGGTTLAVEVDYHRHVAKRLAALPGLKLHHNGEHEKTFLFDVADFEKVAQIVQPRRRLQLTEEQRAALVERLARVRPNSSETPRVVAAQTSADG